MDFAAMIYWAVRTQVLLSMSFQALREEEYPLSSPAPNDPSFSSFVSAHPIFSSVFSLLFVVSVVSAVALGILYSNEKGNSVPPPPPPSLPDAYDFPVWQQQSWNISANHTRDWQRYLTDSGLTWSSVEVSPSGDSIVFDSLGDLFLLDIDKSSSLPLPFSVPVLLVGGVEWAREPRFNSNGTRVYYTSDASGLDNIW